MTWVPLRRVEFCRDETAPKTTPLKLGVLHATEPPTEQKKDAVREQAWLGRQWETNEAKQEQSSLGAPTTRSDQARVASSREDTGGVGGKKPGDLGCLTEGLYLH
jgi:hypothetical protein